MRGSHVARVLDALIEWDDLPDYDSADQTLPPRDALIDAIEHQIANEIAPLGFAIPPTEAIPLAEYFPLHHTEAEGGYVDTISLIFWYQNLLGQNGWFFLSVQDHSTIFGCSTATSSAYLRRAVRENVIVVTKEYSKARRRAREFYWTARVISCSITTED
jgi:hypothetical protein